MNVLTRRQWLTGTLATAAGLVGVSRPAFAQARPARSSDKPHLTVYKDPNCGCCGE